MTDKTRFIRDLTEISKVLLGSAFFYVIVKPHKVDMMRFSVLKAETVHVSLTVSFLNMNRKLPGLGVRQYELK
jgi:hypothetical protein